MDPNIGPSLKLEDRNGPGRYVNQPVNEGANLCNFIRLEGVTPSPPDRC